MDLLEEAADPGARPAAQGGRNLAVDAVTDALAALPFRNGRWSSCTISRDCPTLRSQK